MIYILIAIVLLFLMSNGVQIVNGSTSGSRSDLPRAKRNNNPGNLMYAGQPGACGVDKDGFAIFPDEKAGWEALQRQIELDAGRGHNIWTFFHKYAPPEYNNTIAYITFVTNVLSLDSLDIPIAEVDHDKLAQAIARYEGFYA